MRLFARAAALTMSLAVAARLGTSPAWATFSTLTAASTPISSATLAAPTGLTAALAGATVSLSWTATTSTMATGTRVLRATVAGGPYSQIAQIAGASTTTAGDSPGTGTFFYVVVAYDMANGASWTSAGSNEVTVTVGSATPTFVQVVGTASCAGPTNTVTLAGPGVAAGHTVVLVVVVRGAPSAAGTVAAADSNLSSYSVDADATNPAGIRSLILSARLSSSLAAGASITVTSPVNTNASVAVADVSGVTGSARVDATATATGSSKQPAATVATTTANDMLIAVNGEDTKAVSYTEANGWSTASDEHFGCSNDQNGNGQFASHVAYRTAAVVGNQVYSPTAASGPDWALAIVAYKPG